MYYLRYLFLFAPSVVQHILHCVFGLFASLSGGKISYKIWTLVYLEVRYHIKYGHQFIWR
jgi:hypothetical protein